MLPDGAAIYEELKEVGDERMEMQYKITKGPFPITGYVSNVKVEKTSERSCKITWGCEFDTEPDAEEENIGILAKLLVQEFGDECQNGVFSRRD